MDMIQDPAGEIILTIAIPTYNGAGTLRETLDSVVTQLQPGVDILISDNASTDGTAEIVQNYQDKFPQIRYRRNFENVGADQNYELVIRHALGRFVWLFSDDDVLENGAIEKVVSAIDQAGENFGLIVVDCQVYSFTHQLVLLDGLNSVKASYCLPAGANIFHDPVRDMIGVASTILLRRELLDNVNCTPLIGTSHMHIGIAAYLSTKAQTLVLDNKLFTFRRDGVPRWTNLSYDERFYLGYERAALFGIGNLRAIEHLVEHKVWRLPRYLIQIRASARAIPWRSLFAAVAANDLQIYRRAAFWFTLPLLLVVAITPAFVYRPLKLIRAWHKRRKLQRLMEVKH